MPRFEPFAALRYRPDLPLDMVTAPPYDVLSEADLDALGAHHDRNVVLVDVPRERDGAGRYAQAAARLQAWIADGTLVHDERPSYTIYRMSFADETGRARVISGVLGALEVVDEGAGGVLPHERTTPKAKTDRLDLTRATRCNLSPVWGLSLADGLTAALGSAGDTLGSFVDSDGVLHAVERVDDPARVAQIGALVSGAEVVIADGHHRYAIGRTYRDEQRAQAGAGPWDLTLTYVNELVEDQLNVAAIHRLYSGIDAEALREVLVRSFAMQPAGQMRAATTLEMAERGCLCMVAPDGSGTFLTPRAGAFDRVRDLDSARLEHALDGVAHAVAFQHGVNNVLGVLGAGEAVAGILIRPVPVAEIRRTAHERLLMPPKSTFFTPKLKTGLVIREL